MTELPKKFPEYSLMYKTLKSKVQELDQKKRQTLDETELRKIQSDLDQYQKEMFRIKALFPENFFE